MLLEFAAMTWLEGQGVIEHGRNIHLKQKEKNEKTDRRDKNTGTAICANTVCSPGEFRHSPVQLTVGRYRKEK